MTEDKKKIETWLDACGRQGFEAPRAGLSQEIIRRIPARLSVHRLDAINIIVDLRISRLAAAAAIVVAIFLAGGVFGGRDALRAGIYRDSRQLIANALGGEEEASQDDLMTWLTAYLLSQRRAGNNEVGTDILTWLPAYLLSQGEVVAYYGPSEDPNAILWHWRYSQDTYLVMLADYSARVVSAASLDGLIPQPAPPDPNEEMRQPAPRAVSR